MSICHIFIFKVSSSYKLADCLIFLCFKMFWNNLSRYVIPRMKTYSYYDHKCDSNLKQESIPIKCLPPAYSLYVLQCHPMSAPWGWGEAVSSSDQVWTGLLSWPPGGSCTVSSHAWGRALVRAKPVYEVECIMGNGHMRPLPCGQNNR